MKIVSASALLLHAAQVLAQGRDCGSFTMSCDGAEGACNNACYYINCIAPPNADRVVRPLGL